MKQYFGVVYLENGDACIWSSCESEEEVRNAMKKAIAKNPTKIKATTFMVRESDKKLTLFDLFGHPKSRDLMQDKKFLSTL